MEIFGINASALGTDLADWHRRYTIKSTNENLLVTGGSSGTVKSRMCSIFIVTPDDSEEGFSSLYMPLLLPLQIPLGDQNILNPRYKTGSADHDLGEAIIRPTMQWKAIIAAAFSAFEAQALLRFSCSQLVIERFDP